MIRAAAVQMRFAPTIAGNLAAIGAALGEAARRSARVALLPECATTGYGCDFARLRPEEVRDALGVLSEMARRNRLDLLAGTPLFSGGRLFNALVVIDRRGRPVHAYAKIHLTRDDRRVFSPGDAVALFRTARVPATAILCHERRYPELVRLGVMAGARIVFHPNAGMDALAVSKAKRGGRDGIAVRAFENAAYYVFANSVGPQGGGRWSAGDSKIVAPDGTALALAGNRDPEVIVADLDLAKATGSYASEGRSAPRFLAPHWRRMIADVRKRASRSLERFSSFDSAAPRSG